jgi:PKD repeat protein
VKVLQKNGLITIPSNVSMGPRYLRVVAQQNDYLSSVKPCGNYFIGGTEDYKIMIVPLEPPVVDFDANIVETIQRDVVEFVDKSTNSPNSWLWTITPGVEGVDYIFVDDTDDTNQNPHLKFFTLGQFTVELAATNSEGTGSMVKTNYITIHDNAELPVAGFIIEDSVVYPGDWVHFTDISTNTPTEWEWIITPGSEGVDYSFVNGTDMYSQNPVVVFSNFGFYSVQLIASNIVGDSNPIFENDIVEVENVFFMQNGNFTTCGGVFFDEGGPYEDYQEYSSYIMTFYPAVEGKMIRFDFTEFLIGDDSNENCSDKLIVYDGTSIYDEMVGVFCYVNPLDSVIASNNSGALTFMFNSDFDSDRTGWAADISCVDRVSLYEVSLILTLDNEPVAGALINCDGAIRITNSSGEARFYMEAGNYEYSISSAAIGNESGSFEVIDQDLTINLAYTGINSVSEPDLKIYPNPTLDIVNVELDKEIGKYQIEVLDLQGRTMISKQADKMKSVIDVSSLTEGVYQIVIQNDRYHFVQKMIKQ